MIKTAARWLAKVVRIIGTIIGIVSEKVPARRPKTSQAGMRVALACIIQIVGTTVVLVPLSLEKAKDGWQLDCYDLGWKFGGIGAFVLFVTSMYVILARENLKVVITEWVIKVIYTTNIIGLSLAMTRVGDPSTSVFGHIIPLQLSGILLLEQQKDSMTTPSRYAALRYGTIALLIWIAAVWLRESIVQLPFLWTGAINPCTSGCNDKLATQLLIPFEIAFTVLAFYISRWKQFSNFFGTKKRRASSVNKSSEVE